MATKRGSVDYSAVPLASMSRELSAHVVASPACNCKERLLNAVAGRGDLSKQEKEKFTQVVQETL